MKNKHKTYVFFYLEANTGQAAEYLDDRMRILKLHSDK